MSRKVVLALILLNFVLPVRHESPLNQPQEFFVSAATSVAAVVAALAFGVVVLAMYFKRGATLKWLGLELTVTEPPDKKGGRGRK